MNTASFMAWLRDHRIAIAVIAAVITVWAAAGGAVWKSMNDAIAAQEAVNAQKTQDIAALTEDIKEKKTKEEAQRLEEEKRQQKATTQQSTNEGSQTPGQGNAPAATGNCNTATTHAQPAAIDVLVNKKHCLVPLTFTPPDLVTTHGATISAKAAADFNRMVADAAAAGQPFTVSSSYRSYATQVSTYNYWVSVNGQAGADTVSARPGYSEHQTGLAVDVGANGCNLDCFKTTSQYQWFQANAANYGFIQRYYAGYEAITGYASEEWHYRYVGTATAQDMRAKGIKTLEQYWGLEGGNYRS